MSNSWITFLPSRQTQSETPSLLSPSLRGDGEVVVSSRKVVHSDRVHRSAADDGVEAKCSRACKW